MLLSYYPLGLLMDCRIGHFTVVHSVTRPMNGSEAASDLVPIETPTIFIM